MTRGAGMRMRVGGIRLWSWKVPDSFAQSRIGSIHAKFESAPKGGYPVLQSGARIDNLMKTLLPIILSALIASPVLADITLIQDTQVNGVKSRTAMFIKGNKVRTDNDTTSSVIMDTATGDMTTLVHEQKMLIKMNTKELQALAAPAKATDQPLPVTKITATGKLETIDGYPCEIYLSENQGTVVKMWVSKTYPGQEKLREEMKVMAKLAADGKQQPEVPGIALKSEFEQQGLKFTTFLVSIKAEPVAESRFAIPAGYKAP